MGLFNKKGNKEKAGLKALLAADPSRPLPHAIIEAHVQEGASRIRSTQDKEEVKKTVQLAMMNIVEFNPNANEVAEFQQLIINRINAIL